MDEHGSDHAHDALEATGAVTDGVTSQDVDRACGRMGGHDAHAWLTRTDLWCAGTGGPGQAAPARPDTEDDDDGTDRGNGGGTNRGNGGGNGGGRNRGGRGGSGGGSGGGNGRRDPRPVVGA